MRKLEEDSDSIKALGLTPLKEFSEGDIATVTDVTSVPRANGSESYVYTLETEEGVKFQLSHEDLEQAIETNVVTVHH